MSKKTVLSSAIAVVLGGASLSASALITTSATLEAVDGGSVLGCPAGGTPPACNYGFTTTSFTGSWFSMDANGDGSVALSEITLIDMTVPIHIGTTNTATGSHPGLINGSESPAFDIWEFFSNTGMDYVRSPITLVNDFGSTKELDFSGWTVTWSGIPAIDMGGGTQDCGTTSDGICGTGVNDQGGIINNGTGLAVMVCDVSTCSSSSTFVLDYNAVVPLDDPSGFGGVPYALHMEGHVGTQSAVPVPAAAWLFGSGLVGLVGVARRKKASS